jgi:hypothetical protein
MKRKGTIVLLAAFMLVFMMVVFALAVDLGNIYWTETQTQNSADAAALAGAHTLYVYPKNLEVFSYSFPDPDDSRAEARKFVRENTVAQFGKAPRTPMDISPTDVIIGRWIDGTVDPDEWFPNAVQVTVALNNANYLFGYYSKTHSSHSVAVATVKYPHLLPFTMWHEAWDGQRVTIFPGPWNGIDLPPGNFGALDIGPLGGGSSQLRRQISDGINAADLSTLGGTIGPGTYLNGETGIKAGMETAFVGGQADGRWYDGIIGDARFIPLYDYVEGNGANATFRIKKFVAAKVVEVSLKSGDKYIILEPIAHINDLVRSELVK